MPPRTILVTGATGQQGGAVIKALVATPPPFEHKILALTRNVESKRAKKLVENGNGKVEIIQGDLEDSEGIVERAGGSGAIWGVFLVTVPDLGGNDAANKETTQGCAMVDAAVANGVKHFVYSSVDRGGPGRSDTNPTTIAHFVAKHNVEEHLREKASGSEMSWTILRPVAFMENMKPGFFCKIFAAMWLGMGEEKKLQLVSTKDIGIFTTKAFAESNGEEFKNQAISLAGDELMQAEGNEVFWKIYGRPMPRTYVLWGRVLQAMIAEVGIMFQWFKDEGYGADIQQCRKINPKMLDLETWLREESGYLR